MEEKLYGRRILHVLSPVRWKSTKWMHHADSNWKMVQKHIEGLPNCHHYVLIPSNNTLEKELQQDNITWIPFPYPSSVLANRGYFDYKALREFFDWRKHDLDFVFLSQPELFYNVMSGLLSERMGTSIDVFLFFHWVDCPKSKPSPTYTDGFWRQIEAIDLSTKTFFHSKYSLEYLKLNWKRPRITGEIIDENIIKKITYMTTPSIFFKWVHKSTPVPLPNKKILVFNHRWNETTGIKKLIDYTKDLDRNEYLVWVTDENAKNPKSGSPAPEWMKVQSFKNITEYQYLIEKSFATMCFVDGYATWNLSVQDAVCLNRPSFAYHHPVMDEIIGKNYPFYFKTKNEFLDKLQTIEKNMKIDWELPDHEQNFIDNLRNAMIESIEKYEAGRKQEPHSQDGKRLYGREWLWHIINNNGYKKNILYNTHKDLHLSNSWEHLRKWCLMVGAIDDPNSSDCKLFIPKDKIKEIEKMLDDPNWIDRRFSSESKKDPSFIITSSDRRKITDWLND